MAGGSGGDRFQYSLGVTQLYGADGVGGDLPYRDTAIQGSVTLHLSPGTLLTARLYGANAIGKLASSPTTIGTPPGTGIITAVPGVNFLPAPDNSDYTRAGRIFTGAVSLTGQPLGALSYSLSYQPWPAAAGMGMGLQGRAISRRVAPARCTMGAFKR